MLTCATVTANGINTAGYEGEVRWEMTGFLAPGIQGSVIYHIAIQ
ncbi:hypothetical protein [Photobacterium iliopiscarium]|nr:hypothetical protein [Photobacterium iliopiscarium]